jgi:hypothetical protein
MSELKQIPSHPVIIFILPSNSSKKNQFRGENALRSISFCQNSEPVPRVSDWLL